MIGNAKRANLARSLQIVERPRYLFRLRERIRAMNKENVNVIRAQRPERLLRGGYQVLIRGVVSLTSQDARLGLDGELGPVRRREPQCLGEPLLAVMVLVA